jgi:hypothetical protein
LAGFAALYAVPWIWAFSRRCRSGREIAIRFVACSGAILLGIAVFEVPAIMGLVDYRLVFSAATPPWQRPGHRPDPDLIFARMGPQRVVEFFTGNETPWLRDAGPSRVYRSDRQYDRDGFRNNRDLATADVVVIGDSFIEGAHVSEAELVTTRLATLLEGSEGILNLGRAAYGPEQELHVLKRFGLRRRPAACVWAFYEGNDLDDIAEYRVGRGTIADCLRTGRGLAPGFADRSFTPNALGFVLRTWIDPPPRWPASRYRGRFRSNDGHQIFLDFANGDYRREPIVSERTSPSLIRLRMILKEAQDCCRDAATRLIIVFIPTKLRVYRDACLFPSNSVCAGWPLDDLPRIIGELAIEISPEIRYLDLTPQFRSEAISGKLLYLPDDTHWSPEGHQFAARAIAELVR